MINSINNPWAGLASYEDPKKGGKLKFCGRDNDIYDVSRLIDDNLLLILYGKSGIGKTSLLNAGVFPKLRHDQYMPVSIRLGTLSSEVSFQEAIITVIENTVKENLGSFSVVNVVNEQLDNQQPDRLWNYFSRHRFFDADHKPIFPVVVLDQFEEVLRYSTDNQFKKSLALLNQIQYLVDESHALNDCFVDGKEYFYDFNFRFVISIREDELFLLEDCIDDWSLNMFKNCRYRLRPMKPEQARQVVLIPGKECIEEDEKEEVAERVVALAQHNKTNIIDTLLLSLVCSNTFERKTDAKLHLSDFDFWGDNPMRIYYQEAIRPLSPEQVHYLHENLIERDGSRKRVQKQSIIGDLGGEVYDQLLKGSYRILSLTSDDKVELLHDQLALAIFEDRDAYEARERNWRFMEMQSRYIASSANDIVESGFPDTAQRLLLEVLPKNILEPDKPYTKEAEIVLRKACRHSSEIQCEINYATFSPDGKHIVSTSNKDNYVRIWDTISGDLLSTMKGHTSRITSVTYSSDGERIVSASKDGTILVWNARSGNKLLNINNPNNHTSSASLSPDGKLIVTVSWSGTVNIWNVESSELLFSLDSHNGCYNLAVISPDGKRIITYSFDRVSNDFTATIWDTESRKVLLVLKGHKRPITSISFSPNGERIVSTSKDKTLRIWDTGSGKALHTITSPTIFTTAAFSSDGKRIVSASEDNIVRILDVESGQILFMKEHNSSVISVSFSPEGQRIISTTKKGNAIIWDSESGNILNIIGVPSISIHSAVFSPNGDLIVSAGVDGALNLWDAKSVSLLHSFKMHSDRVHSATFSPDGKRIVSTSMNQIIIWDVESKKALLTMEGHTDQVISASFSPDGKRIVSISKDNTVKTWDTESGKLLLSFELKTAVSTRGSAIYSPNGKRIVTVSGPGSVDIWDAESGKPILSLEGLPLRIETVAFSPDGKRIVTTSESYTVNIWDAESGEKLLTMKNSYGSIQSAVFSLDGNRIVATTRQGSATIWNAKTGNVLPCFIEPIVPTLSNVISPDGRSIISTSCLRTSVACIYDFPPLQELIDETRKQFKDNPLTPEERKQYYLE